METRKFHQLAQWPVYAICLVTGSHVAVAAEDWYLIPEVAALVFSDDSVGLRVGTEQTDTKLAYLDTSKDTNFVTAAWSRRKVETTENRADVSPETGPDSSGFEFGQNFARVTIRRVLSPRTDDTLAGRWWDYSSLGGAIQRYSTVINLLRKCGLLEDYASLDIVRNLQTPRAIIGNRV